MAPLPPDGFIAHYITGVVYPASWVGGVELAALAVVLLSWASWVLYFRRDIGRGVGLHRQGRAITRGACDDES